MTMMTRLRLFKVQMQVILSSKSKHNLGQKSKTSVRLREINMDQDSEAWARIVNLMAITHSHRLETWRENIITDKATRPIL